MTLEQAIQEAEKDGSPNWRDVLAFMRFKMGLTRAQVFACLRKTLPKLTAEQFESICADADRE